MLEVSVYLDEDDLYEGKPLHEYLVRHLMHHEIVGATVFAAVMGYGHKHHLHHPNKFGAVDERPIMIQFIDEEARVHAVLPHIKEIVKEGLIIMKKVERV